jgi:hypothetical protein
VRNAHSCLSWQWLDSSDQGQTPSNHTNIKTKLPILNSYYHLLTILMIELTRLTSSTDLTPSEHNPGTKSPPSGFIFTSILYEGSPLNKSLKYSQWSFIFKSLSNHVLISSFKKCSQFLCNRTSLSNTSPICISEMYL